MLSRIVLIPQGEVVTNNGERLVGETGGGHGDPSTPMSDAEIEGKFRRVTEEVLGAKRVDAMLEFIWHLEIVENITAIPPMFVLD